MTSTSASTSTPAKVSLSFANRKPKPAPSSKGIPTNVVKRPHNLLAAETDAQDASSVTTTSHISHFGAEPLGDAGSSIGAAQIIAPLPNKRWGRNASAVEITAEHENGEKKRQKSELRGRASDAESAVTGIAADTLNDEKSKPIYGLNVRQRSPQLSKTPPRSLDASSEASESSASGDTNGNPKPTEEQEALDRLMGKTTSSSAGAQTTIAPVARNEDDAFRTDYASAPREASLEDYQATPVEGFGAALMRGYLPKGDTLESWKERVEQRLTAGRAGRAGKGKKVKAFGEPPERRKELLGLGATEMDLGLDKDGKGKKKSRREAMEYNPLARRNMATGEVLGESEFRERVEAGQKGLVSNGQSGENDNNRGTKPNGNGRKLLENGHGQDEDERQISSRHSRHPDRDERPHKHLSSDKDRRRDREYRHDRSEQRDRDDDTRWRHRDRDDDTRRRHRDRSRDRDRDRTHDYKSSRREHKHRDRSRESHKHQR